jgi:GH15 family glucan-1,4-alpha-glucosidase
VKSTPADSRGYPSAALRKPTWEAIFVHVRGDYRLCWLRDATLTLLGLMNAGYDQEANDWREWLLRAVAGYPEQVQIVYGIAGERRLTEWVVPWLPGYEGSAPVRIGNDAYRQRQLDVFGEVMDALHQARIAGLAASESGWELQIAFLAHLERIWSQPDQGIWEVRGSPKHFTYSKVMAWVAFVGRSRVRKLSALQVRSPIGAHWPPTSMTTCAGAALTLISAALSSPMGPNNLTQAYCCLRPSDFCQRMTRASRGR